MTTKQAIEHAKILAIEVSSAFTLWITFRRKRHEDRYIVAQQDMATHCKKYGLKWVNSPEAPYQVPVKI